MKTSLFPLLVIPLFLASCSRGITDLDRYGLRGQIKSIKEVHYEATYTDDKWVPGKPLSANGEYRIINYGKDGNYLELLSFNQAGDTISITTCKREKGDIVEETYFSYYSGQSSTTIMERVSEEQVNFELWQGGRLQYEGANYYDSKGRLVKQVQVVDEREVTVNMVIKKNLVVETYQEEMDGTRTATWVYDYDEFDDKENWTIQLVYMEKDKITPSMIITREIEYY